MASTGKRHAKPVSLTAHKNTVEQRRKRELGKDLRSIAGDLVRERDIRAYALVGIASDGSSYAYWDTGACLPMRAFPDTVASILRDSIAEAAIEDDWRPTLTVGGTRNQS
jgi:hypothetical protein